ncbi:MAG: 2-C-methyl-D-erythritol 4-phosphate cytidylyltransferase, partial [Deltaproteobacteria bacterium]|nr:2-C-methyl-D-erythritol 4-phosphate cytidylyltransferase [Deltaproteobacteria bacterium]
MARTPRVVALIPAAGRGRRMGLGENKLFQPLLGRPLLIHTLEKFEACPVIGEIIVMVGRGEVARWRREIRAAGCHKVSRVVVGGVERQDSVRL